jgi:molybdopterin-guanine dinucleotide biosynthesis protein A
MVRKIRCGGRPVTAIVLAGGRGRRMKADKARLSVGGGTLLDRVLRQVAPFFDEVLISVSPGQRVEAGRTIMKMTWPSRQRKIGPRPSRLSGHARPGPKPRIVEDETRDQGPMAGILAGLRAAANDVCAVIACDIPDVHVPLVRRLVRAAAEADIAVPVTPAGQFEPLFAVYSKAVIPAIETLLRAGERSLIPLFGRCRTVRFRLENVDWLRNLNTREDYRAYLAKIGQRQKRL